MQRSDTDAETDAGGGPLVDSPTPIRPSAGASHRSVERFDATATVFRRTAAGALSARRDKRTEGEGTTPRLATAAALSLFGRDPACLCVPLLRQSSPPPLPLSVSSLRSWACVARCRAHRSAAVMATATRPRSTVRAPPASSSALPPSPRRPRWCDPRPPRAHRSNRRPLRGHRRRTAATACPRRWCCRPLPPHSRRVRAHDHWARFRIQNFVANRLARQT